MLDTLLLLMLEVPGSPGGVVPREALEIGGVGAEVGVGAGAETEEKNMAKRRMAKRRTSMPATETSMARKEATQGAAVVVRPATKRCDAPDGCVAFAAERSIRRKCAPTSSPSSPAKLTRVAATATGFLAEKSRTPLSAMHQASFFTSLVNGVHALAWQVGDLPVVCDNGASCHMCHSSTGITFYREANATMRTASGKRYPIEGYGDLPLTFRSISGEVPLLLCNVAHVPSLSYHLLSLRVAADNGHTYTGNKTGVTVKFKTGETLFFPSVGRLNFLYAYRPGALNDENANAVIAPGPEPSNRGTSVDINAFHAAHAHAHEGALRKTAKQMGVILKGELHECKDCSMVKDIWMPIPSKTHGRAAKRLFRVFVDLGGKKDVASMGGNKYPMIVRDDFSRRAWMYFVSHKHDSASALEKFLADLRVEGTPSEVVIVRSDDGGEFMEGKFGKLCRERKIKQEFTTNCRQLGIQLSSRAKVGHDRVL